MARKNSLFVPAGSLTSLAKGDSDSEISNFSFKHWHKHMQSQHERLQQAGESLSFKQWAWCSKVCLPCRWFDNIPYDKKICHCCLEFRTFKTFGTLIITAIFFYLFLLSILREEVLPGGTGFFILFMILTAYTSGYIAKFLGLPPMIGHLIIGIVFKNVPGYILPPRDDDVVNVTAIVSELVLLVIALIRAGLLLDLSRIKRDILFIVVVSLFPFTCEFLLIWVASHFLLGLPWQWSAVQGSILSIVSLASVTSVMEKNRINGYGEDKHLSTVLIAASALNVVFGVLSYSACRSLLSPQGDGWLMLQSYSLEIIFGPLSGALCGLLIAYFPDKRNSEAAAVRILVIGIGAFAIAGIYNSFDKMVGGVTACLTFCVTAVNMWQELGWHHENNPVQYFYTLAYYMGQPIVLSLVGFSINFWDTEASHLGMSFLVILIGLVGRESVCLLVLSGKSYPTTMKEKIFICIAWMSKGSFQAVLSTLISEKINTNKGEISEGTKTAILHYLIRCEETTILAILLTTPLACYSLTLLTPKLLTKQEPAEPTNSPESNTQAPSKRNRLSSVKFKDSFLLKKSKTSQKAGSSSSTKTPESNV